MAKYVVLQEFRDKETKEVYEVGQEVEMTVKRADEAIKNLKKWDGEFLERIDNKEKEENPPEGNGEGEQEQNKEVEEEGR